MIAKTAGIEGTFRELFRQLKQVKMALLYGSFAKGKERKDSDVDLLIVGSPRVEDRLMKEIPRLEKQLQREINYKLYSEAEYRRRRSQGDPFLEEVLSDKKVVLKGDLDAF